MGLKELIEKNGEILHHGEPVNAIPIGSPKVLVVNKELEGDSYKDLIEMVPKYAPNGANAYHMGNPDITGPRNFPSYSAGIQFYKI